MPQKRNKNAVCDIMLTMKTQKGINVRKWCLTHEAYIDEKLAGELSAEELSGIIKLHEKRLSWLMHERLIHLIVLFITVILVLFSMALILLVPDTICASLPMFLITFILAVFYVRHYFFLENTVQHWYEMDEAISQRFSDT